MRFLSYFVAVTLVAAPLFASGPKPFVGGSLQVNSPTGDFSGENITQEQGGAKTNVGGEIDAGITLSSASAYLGYRFGKHNAEGAVETPSGDLKTDGEWEINRWVVGARFQLLPPVIPVSPIIGGGITAGATSVQSGGQDGGIVVKVDEQAKSSLGWFLEAGALVKTGKALSFVGSLQYHRFDTEFDTELYRGAVKISFFTLNAGVRFTLI